MPPKTALLLSLLLLLLAACQPAQALPVDQPAPTLPGPTPLGLLVWPGLTLTATPTQTPRATLTPTATLTPAATTTPAASPTLTPTAEPPLITLLFSGAIVPARCVQAEIDRQGSAAYLYENVRDLLASADLAVGTLNASLSDVSPHTGCVSTFVLVGSSNNADALAEAGFDAMSVATNHIKNCALTNCGDQAFLETLANLRRVGIAPIGAGETLAEALQPVVFEVQGVRIAIVSLGEIEPLAFAGDSTPGIAVLTEQNLRAALAAADLVGDVVIAMPHWGPEYTSTPNWSQRTFAQVAVSAGADLVVGNHTHVVQAVQDLNGVPVFYGLGSFVFDQTWARENQQSVLLKVTLHGAQVEGWELIPVVSDGTGRVSFPSAAERDEILQRIQTASQGLD